jgi:aminoglycoside 3-N-acetyltransferase
MSSSAPKVAPDDRLLKSLRNVGIVEGDIVYVASSLMALGHLENPVKLILDSIRMAVGKSGTIVMPAFNFDFCKGIPFDPKNSVSQTGVLSEAFRKENGVKRTTSTPFHSVCTEGALANEILELSPIASFDSNSVFQYLKDNGGKQLLIGCGYQQGVVHFHWLEELYQVPYRYWKKFDGEIIGEGQKSFFQYVRYNGEKCVTGDAEPLGKRFEESGLVREDIFGLCKIKSFLFSDFFNFMSKIFKKDPLALLNKTEKKIYEVIDSPFIGIHHIGIVSKYKKTIQDFIELIGYSLRNEGIIEEMGIKVSYFSGKNVKIEFVEPIKSENIIENFYKSNAPSPIHHIAIEVNNLEKAMNILRKNGYIELNGKEIIAPHPYQYGYYLNPVTSGGILIELIHHDLKND